MSLPPNYWLDLAADYVTADAIAFATFDVKPTRNNLILEMSVAQLETRNGLAWPGSNNFGAVQLRGLTPAEYAAFQAGTLKAGDFLPNHSGVLHVDTHPPGIQYPVWFFAAPTRVLGIAHFLKTLYRLTGAALEQPDTDAATLAQAMYVHHYFEGRHVDDRPWQPARKLPLSAPEQANVDAYAKDVQACRDMIEPQLEAWDYGHDQCVTTSDALAS